MHNKDIKKWYEPCGFRILVELKQVDEELEVKSDGGIVLQVKTKSKIKAEQKATQEAYVRAIGPTAFKAFDDGQAWCKVGDCVLICKYSGDDLDDIEEDKVYRVIADRDIQAVITDYSEK